MDFDSAVVWFVSSGGVGKGANLFAFGEELLGYPSATITEGSGYDMQLGRHCDWPPPSLSQGFGGDSTSSYRIEIE